MAFKSQRFDPAYLHQTNHKAVDFRKLYEIVEPLYSEEEGRASIDPVVLFKIVLLQHLDGIPSLRGTLRRAQTDIACRRRQSGIGMNCWRRSTQTGRPMGRSPSMTAVCL